MLKPCKFFCRRPHTPEVHHVHDQHRDVYIRVTGLDLLNGSVGFGLRSCAQVHLCIVGCKLEDSIETAGLSREREIML